MIKLFMCLIALFVSLTACAGHYYKVRGELVHFHLKIPDAESVVFLSSLDGYESHKVKKSSNETWEISVPAKAEFKYFFIVDGKHFLPDCDLKEFDDFGSENCVFTCEM